MKMRGPIMHIKRTLGEKVFDTCNIILMCFIIVITLYPLLYVISMSISNPIEAIKGTVYFYPKGLDFTAYKMIVQSEDIFRGYTNSIFYATVGTAINILMTVLAAYPLTRREFSLRKILTIMIVFTMFFSGGLIPMYILMTKLPIFNTRWAIIIPVAVDSFLIFVTRTYFNTIPESLLESAKIDGANDLRILIQIVFPLSLPMMAVLALFYAVGHWNSYFLSILYQTDASLHPIQVFLYRIVSQRNNQFARQMGVDLGVIAAYGIQVRYAVIVAVVLPIVCVYPFLQKYFVKGVMIGAIKG